MIVKVCIEVKSRRNCCIYVVIKFLSQIIVIFLLFQLHLAYITIPKNKRKTKITGDKKFNYNIYIKVQLNLDINYPSYTECFHEK